MTDKETTALVNLMAVYRTDWNGASLEQEDQVKA